MLDSISNALTVWFLYSSWISFRLVLSSWFPVECHKIQMIHGLPNEICIIYILLYTSFKLYWYDPTPRLNLTGFAMVKELDQKKKRNSRCKLYNETVAGIKISTHPRKLFWHLVEYDVCCPYSSNTLIC